MNGQKFFCRHVSVAGAIKLAALWLTLLASSDVYANENLQKALSKAQYMLRQANTENLALQQEIAESKKTIEALRLELEETVAAAQKKEQKLGDTLDAWKDSHSNLKGNLKETRDELQTAKISIQDLTNKLSMQTENFELCVANNRKLSDINYELVTFYEDKSAWDSVSQREPFTQLKKVEVENLVQDYQFKIEDLDLGENQHMIQKLEQDI